MRDSDDAEGMILRDEFTQIGDEGDDLAVFGVLMDLQGAVPRGGQESLMAEGQAEREVRDLVLRVVRDGEVVGIRLVVVLGQALVVQVEDLAPCAASGSGRHGDLPRL